MIEVEHLTKKYGDLIAVNDLSFKVEKGMICGLLGPNAAGKTTTMRILTGYLPANDGKAKIAGFDVFEEINEVKKITGYLPENLPLYPEMIVESYLSFVAEIKQIPSSQRRDAVESAIKISGLGNVRARLIKNISKGFKQRVGIAQALIHSPQILILDEPTIGLDPEQIIEIRKLIKSLRGERTIILSTHILAEVTQTCDGVVIINEGKLMASGTLDVLSASYEQKEGTFIKLRQEAESSISILKNIPGIDSIIQEEDGIKIEWAKGKDLRDQITRIIVENEMGLLEMRPLGANIEDLYLKVMSGGMEQ
jgi:ABC-2 type transport system ATP-binding protein